ncbi:MAG: tetratricopeptide repeat protein [Bdellovibrionota bacterium]
MGGDSEDNKPISGDFFDQLEELDSLVDSEGDQQTLVEKSDSDSPKSDFSDFTDLIPSEVKAGQQNLEEAFQSKEAKELEERIFSDQSDKTEQLRVEPQDSLTDEDVSSLENTLYDQSLNQSEPSDLSETRKEHADPVNLGFQEGSFQESDSSDKNDAPSELRDLFANFDEDSSTAFENRREDVAELFEAKAIRVSASEIPASEGRGRGALRKWAGLAGGIFGVSVIFGGIFFLASSETGFLGYHINSSFQIVEVGSILSPEKKEALQRMIRASEEARFQDDPKSIQTQIMQLESFLIENPKSKEAAEELLEASAVILAWQGPQSEFALKYETAWAAINEIEKDSDEPRVTPRKIRSRAWYGMAHGNVGAAIYDLEKIVLQDDSKDSQDQSLLAELYFRDGKKEKALELLEKVTDKKQRARFLLAQIKEDSSELTKMSAENYFPAKVQVFLNQKGQAENLITQARSLVEEVQIYPQLVAGVWEKLADLYIEVNDRSKAIEAWKSYLAIHQESASIREKLAEAYEQEGQLKDAIESYQAVIKYEPRNKRSILRLSKMYRSQNQVLEALNVLERAAKEEPSVAEYHYETGLAQMMILQEAQAKESFEKALAVNPKFELAILGLAQMAIDRGDLEVAENLFSRISKNDAHYSQALIGLGEISILKRDSKQAKVFFRQAIDADAKNEMAYLILTEQLLRDEREAEAKALSQKALKELPRSPIANMSLAKVLSFEKKFEEAHARLEPFIKANSEIPPFSWAYIDLLIQSGRLAQAKTNLDQLKDRFQDRADWHYLSAKWNWKSRELSSSDNSLNFVDAAWRSVRTALHSEPQNEKYLELQAQVALALNDTGQALELSDNLLRQFPTNRIGLEVLGDALSSSGQYQKALQSYEKALSQTKFKARLFRKLAELHQNQGNVKQAVSYFEQLVKWSPRDAKAHLDLGRVYSEEGQLTKALKAFEKATELAPNSPEAFYFLGFIQKSRGERQQAIQSFEKFLKLKPSGVESATIEDEIYFLRTAPSSN